MVENKKRFWKLRRNMERKEDKRRFGKYRRRMEGEKDWRFWI